eukprot:scaffold592452_cov34-Prasinocladus_malaysianus.AAC.1
MLGARPLPCNIPNTVRLTTDAGPSDLFPSAFPIPAAVARRVELRGPQAAVFGWIERALGPTEPRA